MAIKRTPNLGLILENGLTQLAKDNLLRLDTIGGLLSLQNDDSALIQAIQDIRLQPASPALGGTPGQGALQLGADGLPCLRVDAYATQFNIKTAGAFRLRESNSIYSLGIVYAVTGGASSDRSLTISTVNANRSLTLGTNFETQSSGGGIILSLTSASDQTLTIPASGVAVLEAHAQTLTNKSFDADQNTLTNIDNLNIKASAGIDAEKLADGSVSNTEFQTLNGVTSNIQTQLDGKQPTGLYLTALTGDVVAAGPGSAAATIQPLAISTAKLQDGAVTYAKASLTNGIVNADINSAAAIQYSKLNLSASIVNADVAPGAAIAGSKVAPQFGNQQIETSQGLRLTSGAFTLDFQAPALPASYTFTLPNTGGVAGYVLTTNGSGVTSWAPVSGTGTVTSVALDAPASIFSVSGSPVTVSGTLGLTLQTQSANLVWAGPTSGGPAQPTFRSLVEADVPTLSPSKLTAQTASRALVSDASGYLAASITNSTEISYLSGVTSAIQTQLNGKQPTGNYITALNGDVTASGPGFATATIANDAITNAKVSPTAAIAYSKLALTDSIVNADIAAAAAIADTKLATISSAGKVANSATTATSANTANAIVARDASGNFTAGTISATAINAAAYTSHFKATWVTADGLTKVVTHGLGTLDVMVQLYDIATGETILVDSTVRNSVNQVTLSASEAPGASGWRILIQAILT
jgi:hypothetical protein